MALLTASYHGQLSYICPSVHNTHPTTVVALHFGEMATPPGQLMTGENLISTEEHQKSPTYGHVTHFFLNRNFNTKKINKRKKPANSQQNLALFRQQQIQNVKLSKHYTEKDETKFRQNYLC